MSIPETVESCPYAEMVVRRYWNKIAIIDDEDSCWLWKGAKKPNGGHGTAWNGDAFMAAHRLGYEIAVGPIPEKLIVCHRCDVPLCQRPSHWFLGTHRDNSLDMSRKGRSGMTLHPEQARRGSTNKIAKLDEEKVSRILKWIDRGASITALARHFQISTTVIARIKRGEVWRHVPRPERKTISRAE